VEEDYTTKGAALATALVLGSKTCWVKFSPRLWFSRKFTAFEKTGCSKSKRWSGFFLNESLHVD